MSFLKILKRRSAATIDILQQKVDTWLMKNPYAVLSRLRFIFNQRKHYSPNFSKSWLIVRALALGYVTANIFMLDFGTELFPDKKLLTEYYVLANRIDHDRLEQTGIEQHKRSMYERGLKRGLTQIELLELVKLHEADEVARPLADHIEYLRILKN